MTGFFEDVFGRRHPIAAIRKMIERRDNSASKSKIRVFAELGEDHEVELADNMAERVAHADSPLIAPPPVTYLLEFCSSIPGSKPEPFVDRRPILAFRPNVITGGCDVVVVDQSFDGMRERHGILYPDGRVEDVWGHVWADEATWTADQAMQHERNSKRELAA